MVTPTAAIRVEPNQLGCCFASDKCDLRGPHASGQNNEKGCSRTERALGHDFSFVRAYDAMTNGQADSTAGVFGFSLESLKRPENSLGEFGIKADAVVAHRNLDRSIRAGPGFNMNDGWNVGLTEFNG